MSKLLCTDYFIINDFKLPLIFAVSLAERKYHVEGMTALKYFHVNSH